MMERKQSCSTNENKDTPYQFNNHPHGVKGGTENLVVNDDILHAVLYGQWTEWGGSRPPAHCREKILQEIPKNVLNDVPSEVSLDVSTLPLNRIGIFATSTIEQKTVIGPVPGKKIDPKSCKKTDHAWEILDGTGKMSRVLDTSSCQTWMNYIQDARHEEEQNLETFQSGGAIYYRAIKDILPGEELMVWYGNNFQQEFGVPCFQSCLNMKTMTNSSAFDLQDSVSDEERKKAKCVLCKKGFNSRSNLRSHMRTHTLHKPFECSICFRKFSQSSTLRNHMRLHTGEKPYKCSKCGSAYSQLAGLRAHQKSSQHRPRIISRTDGEP